MTETISYVIKAGALYLSEQQPDVKTLCWTSDRKDASRWHDGQFSSARDTALGAIHALRANGRDPGTWIGIRWDDLRVARVKTKKRPSIRETLWEARCRLDYVRHEAVKMIVRIDEALGRKAEDSDD